MNSRRSTYRVQKQRRSTSRSASQPSSASTTKKRSRPYDRNFQQHLTDGTLVPGNPDRYFGARPEQLDRQIRDELNDQIIPSTQHDFPMAPNFFLAVKGPDGSASVAKKQACYDGALGARGMHSL